MPKICKKCGYERQEIESISEHECPKCGAIYAKVEAHLKRKFVIAISLVLGVIIAILILISTFIAPPKQSCQLKVTQKLPGQLWVP